MKKLLPTIRNPFLVLILAVFLFTAFKAEAQTKTLPWTFSTAWHWTDFYAVGKPVGEQITDAEWIGEVYPAKFSIGRYLIPSLNLETSFAFQKFKQDEILLWKNDAPYPNDYLVLDKDNFYGNLDVELQYSFANGYILSEYSWFTPYIFGGIGATKMNGTVYFLLDYGVGLEAWFWKHLAFNFEAAYDYMPDFHDYMHYSLGIKGRFGAAKDTDKDGIPDSKDACPLMPGLPEFDGCPDTDGDGLVDSLDLCPDVPGPFEFRGCPDTDGDGLPDNIDECPTVPGPKESNGCPDTDGDGIPDKDDLCPNDPGPKETQGCPDRDGDGVADKDDLCPDTPGPKELNGCPDTDGDGVLDKDDECPNDPGPAALNGCPDKDEDGVADIHDKCPDTPGPIENFGCPVIEEVVVLQIEEQLAFEADNIEFETGKYVIRNFSLPNLNNIIKIMLEYPTTKYVIEGHTDNVGGDQLNLDLSQNRAFSVKQYFIDHGIDDGRLTAVGYGESKPIDTNASAEGRTHNRRVEIHMLQDEK